MAKLIVLAFTIATLLVFASAHRTIVSTTIEDDINPTSKSQQCSQHLQGQQFRRCQIYLRRPEQTLYGQQQQTLQQCCQELRNVNEPCVCKAVKKIFGNVQQQTGRPFGSQQVKQKAQNLPNICNIQTRKQCNIKTGQQCQQEVQGQQWRNRCQKYLEQQTGSGYVRSAVSIQNRCCEELRNVDMECQCEAMKEVYSQTQEEHRQFNLEVEPKQHRSGTNGMGELRRIVENLKNQCNLEVEQCQITSGMF